MKTILIFLFVGIQYLNAQTEIELINLTLLDYIEGTANGEPNRLKSAFDKSFNLYSVKNDSLSIWTGENYINGIKEGAKANRIGKVVSIDFAKDVATAKIEIDMPERKRVYTDYLLLAKFEGRWKIIHKAYSYKDYPK